MTDKPSFEISSGIAELLDEPIANKITAGIVAFFLVFVTINTFDLVSNSDNVRSIVDGDNNWTISFDEQIITLTDSVIVADGDTEIRAFTIDETLLDDGYRFGGISVTLTYTETSGWPGDPPDSVFANLIQNDLNAQWQDDNNSLSGSSNDGSQIDLDLRAYPGYDGQQTNTTGYNEIQVLENWIMDDFGIGELELEITVETTTSPIPFSPNDNEEEVNITIEIVTFKAIAQQ
ncbi:MAG: hypothetical protein HOB47_01430 [Euryarchaeota archaeon]|jgi:hypothetical protein|nr:hypothetical protein [Euryarchaeota archaeon]MBT7263629.1 hypothetical protein [Euryarchaeota archaeon]